jgi:hypothetical protein
MKRLNQSGSHILAIALFVLALGFVGFAGYKVSQHGSKPQQTAVTANGTALNAPATIDSKADLSTTAKSLDNSSADLNNSVDGDTLNSSMNDLL